MAIPEFGGLGLLPPGNYLCDYDGAPVFAGHDTTIQEVEGRLVDGFPQSLTRAVLFKELRLLRDIAIGYFDCVLFLISGELVSNKVNPRNVYVVLDVPGDALESLSPRDRHIIDWIFNDAERSFTDEDLKIHTGLIEAYPADHVNYVIGHEQRMFYRQFAASPIPDTNTAGYLEVLECEGGVDDFAAIFRAATA